MPTILICRSPITEKQKLQTPVFHLQHGIPALSSTSGDMTVVFSPSVAKVTERKYKTIEFKLAVYAG